MYFPYLRSKQYELLALREIVSKWHGSGMVLPIIEPISKTDRDLKLFAKALSKVGARYILIENPSVGARKGEQRYIESLIDSNKALNSKIGIAYIVLKGTKRSDVMLFSARHPGHRLTLVHREVSDDLMEILKFSSVKGFEYNVVVKGKAVPQSELSKFQVNNLVLVQDGFLKKARNADYPSEEKFESLYADYSDLGYVGFGDFSIVGNNFSDGGGGKLYTVAIHLTIDRQREIYTKHFLSEKRDYEDKRDTLIKEALREVVAFIKSNKRLLEFSLGCQDFINIYDSGSSTSLALLKKYSMKHHTELMIKLIS